MVFRCGAMAILFAFSFRHGVCYVFTGGGRGLSFIDGAARFFLNGKWAVVIVTFVALLLHVAVRGCRYRPWRLW